MPSDLIDWDAPEMPELEKQRIIYEDYIRECGETHEIELLITEEICKVVHEAILDSTAKRFEDEVTKEKSKVHLLLGQVKMFEDNVKELEEELTSYQNTIANYEQQKEDWNEERQLLKTEIENLTFRNNEITCELSHKTETCRQKNIEVGEYKTLLNELKNSLKHYKQVVKSKD